MIHINTFTIEQRLPGLNEIINANRYNRYAGAKSKRDIERTIGFYIKKGLINNTLHQVTHPVFIKFTWHEKNRRRDFDNIVSAKKFILDALVKKNIIPNDNQKYVIGFTDELVVDKSYYVEVELIEKEVGK